MSHINGLTPAESERLFKSLLEIGQFQKAIGEVLMNGYNEIAREELVNNRTVLLRSLAGLISATALLVGCNDVSKKELEELVDSKLLSMFDQLHYHSDYKARFNTNTATNDAVKEQTNNGEGNNILNFHRRSEK